jgi:hypothetical protein
MMIGHVCFVTLESRDDRSLEQNGWATPCFFFTQIGVFRFRPGLQFPVGRTPELQGRRMGICRRQHRFRVGHPVPSAP